MSEPRTTPPTGAWGGSHQPPVPTAGHAAVVVVSIALAAALVVGGSAVDGRGPVALLMLLLGCGALVVPVTVAVMTWGRAQLPFRVLFAVAGLACTVVLALAVAGIVATWS